MLAVEATDQMWGDLRACANYIGTTEESFQTQEIEIFPISIFFQI